MPALLARLAGDRYPPGVTVGTRVAYFENSPHRQWFNPIYIKPHARGGHLVPWENPEAVIDDVRATFRQIRQPTPAHQAANSQNGDSENAMTHPHPVSDPGALVRAFVDAFRPKTPVSRPSTCTPTSPSATTATTRCTVATRC